MKIDDVETLAKQSSKKYDHTNTRVYKLEEQLNKVAEEVKQMKSSAGINITALEQTGSEEPRSANPASWEGKTKS